MITAVIIVVALFIVLGVLGLHVKNCIGKLFDEFENEEPLDEKDIFSVLHKNENNE